MVDTGSSDRTVEVAKGFGARVLHHPWRGDFSEARNIPIKEASSDWILVLDADEEIESEDILRPGIVSRPSEIISILPDFPIRSSKNTHVCVNSMTIGSGKV